MREIKFKYVWEDITTKEITTGIYTIDDIEEGFSYVGYIILHKLQYTGLKDKNGVEIYEGDIIAIRYSGGDNKGEICYKNEVKYGTFDVGTNGYEYSCFIHGLVVDDEYMNDAMISGDVEVIGNIYENKELLDGKA